MLQRLGEIALGMTGLAATLIDRRPKLRCALVILCYHRVVPMRDPDTFDFDSDVVSATPEDFAWQMQFVRRHFTPIDVDTLRAVLRGERELPPRAILVTFDDGYDDFVKYALRSLLENSVPAVMFVVTGQIGSNEKLWFDQLAYVLQRTEIPRLELPELGIIESLGDRREQRRALYGRVVSALKLVPDHVRVAVLESTKRQCRVREDASVANQALPMNAQQILEAARKGISIQSHTVSHPILAMVDAQRLHAELADSRRTIGDLLGIPPTVLAYPNGTWSDFGPREIDAARQCGYEAAMTYEPGIQAPGSFDPFRLLRLSVNWRHSRSWFRTMLAVPELVPGSPPTESVENVDR